MINARNISKQYGKTQALRGISFSVEKGEIFGLIGPDGAGKTTLFRILSTLILASGGGASINGWDVVKDYRKIRDCLGYMPGKFSLYQNMSIEENLNFFAALFRTTVAENYDLISDIYSQIEPFKKRMAGKLSGGMKQKLALSCALIHRPLALFLDEPTTGIDPVSRKELWAMLRKLKNQGITIVISTPYMDEAMLCDRVALMQKGVIMSIDAPQGVINKFPRKIFAAKSDDMAKLLGDLRECGYVRDCHTFGEFHHFTLRGDMENTRAEIEIKSAMEKSGHKNVEVKEIAPTIEDCFMDLIGGGE